MLNLEAAVSEIRYLLERGYPKQSAITYVCNHHMLDLEIRHVFTRVLYPQSTITSRRAKTVGCGDIDNNEVWIDGYNILIGVESAVRGDSVYLCDDGFLRDTRGVFRNFHSSDDTEQALHELLSVLALHNPERVEIVFDSQISKSREMVRQVDKKMKDMGISGCARTSKHTDFDLKKCNKMVATSDGGIIDVVEHVVNLQSCIMEQLKIKPINIKGLIP
ncbi:MAG: DUF434 domain-containing protein [Methanosarcinales archaeon]|nr:DUF434 domain-containing protein [Methanosarcinales archaeon]